MRFASQGLQYEVRGAKVEKADIECSNGVIHVIDSVMIPDVKCVPPRLLCLHCALTDALPPLS